MNLLNVNSLNPALHSDLVVLTGPYKHPGIQPLPPDLRARPKVLRIELNLGKTLEERHMSDMKSK